MIKSKFSLVFLIISLIFIKIVKSQSADCDYWTHEEYGYSCKLTLSNADESTQISGQHMRQKTDQDVKYIHTFYDGPRSSKIPTNLCEKFKNVEGLFMSSMRIEVIDENLLKNCESLEISNLSWNKIKKLSKNAFASQLKLKSLDLSYNELTELDENLFANLTSLKNLKLDENKIKTLPSRIFTHLIDLEELYLTGNEIQNLPNGIFSSLINLQKLFLNKNQLTTLHFSSFGDAVKKLTKFDIEHNEIKSIDERIIDNNPELKFIGSVYNPCTTSGYEVIEGADTGKPVFGNYSIKSALKDCYSNYKEGAKVGFFGSIFSSIKSVF